MGKNPPNPDAVTQNLNLDWHSGLSQEVYEELRKIAGAQLRAQRPDATLSTTALVNEAYLKIGRKDSLWQDRKHFYATMARVMRQVAIDLARSKQAKKRAHGGKVDLEQLDRGHIEMSELGELIAIDEALAKLGELDPRLEQVLELRFFAGLSTAEVAQLVGRSEPTIKRDARAARAFLASQLELPP